MLLGEIARLDPEERCVISPKETSASVVKRLATCSRKNASSRLVIGLAKSFDDLCDQGLETMEA